MLDLLDRTLAGQEPFLAGIPHSSVSKRGILYPVSRAFSGFKPIKNHKNLRMSL